MSSAPEPEHVTKTKRPARRRWRRVLLALLLTPVVLYVTRDFALHPLLARAAELVGPRVGLDLEVGAVRGNWWSTLALEDVHAAANEESGGLRALDVRRVGLEFKLTELLAGDLAGLRRVELRGASVRYDATLAGAPETEEPAAGWPALPRHLPVVTVEDLAVDVRLAAGELALSGLQLTLEPEPDGDDLRLRVGGLRWTPAGEPPFELGLGLQARHANGVVTIRSLDAGPVHVEDGSTVDLARLDEERVGWDVALEALGGALTTDGELRAGALRARFDGSGFDASRVAFWLPELEPEGLAGLLSIAGSVELAADGSARSEARLEWVEPTWRGTELDQLGVEATLDGSRLGLGRIAATQGSNVVRATDVALALDAPDLATLLGGMTGELQAEVRDLPGLLGRELPDVPPHALELSASLAPDGLLVESGFVETAGGRADIARGRLAWDVARDVEAWPVELEARARFADLGPLGELLGAAPWSGSLEGDVLLDGTLGEPQWTATLAGADLRIADRALGTVGIAARGDAAQARLERFSIDGDDVRAEGAGNVLYEPLVLEGMALSGEVRRPGGWLPALADFLGPTAIVTFDAELSGALTELDGTAIVRGESLRAGGEDLGPWSLDVGADAGALDVRSSRLTTPWGELDLAASCTNPFEPEPEARLDELRLATGDANLALESPARITWSSGAFALSPVRLRGTAGELDLEARQDEAGFVLDARAAGLALAPFLGDILPPGLAFGTLDAVVEARGIGGEVGANTRGTLTDLTWSGLGRRGREASWVVAFEDRSLRIEELTVAEGTDVCLQLTGELPLDPGAESPLAEGPLRLEGLLDLRRIEGFLPPDTPWDPRGAVRASVDLAGAWSGLEGSIQVDAEGVLRPPVADTAPRPEEELEDPEELTATLAGTLELGSDSLNLRAGSARLAGIGSARVEGELGVGANVARWMEEGFAGLFGAPLALTADVDAAELAWLAERVPDLRRTAGQASAAVRLGGTLNEPEITGELTLREGELRTRSQLPPLAAIDADVKFEGQRIRIESCTAELGAAPVGLEGDIELGGESPRFDLRLTGENALLARTQTLRLRADLDLAITETLDALQIAGTVRPRNTRMLVDVDFVEIVQSVDVDPRKLRQPGKPSGPAGLQLFSLRDPPLANAKFDVRVLTEEPVELSGNLMRGELRTDLRLRGTGEVPLPAGSVYLDRFRVSLPSGVMDFDFGRVEFEPGSPFDPVLALRGESKIYGYDVAMTVQGSLSSPELVVSSSPSLDNAALLLMVLTGQAPGGATVQEAGANLALYFGRSLLSAGGALDDGESILSRLEVRSGREVSRSGTPTTEASLRLLSDVAGDESQLLLTGEQDVYENINMGLRLRFVLQ